MFGRMSIVLASLALLAVTAVAALLILQSCALRSGLLPPALAGYCPDAGARAAVAGRIEALRERQAVLTRQIVQAERELAAIPCQAVHAVPEPAPAAPGIDEAAWRAGDLGLLEGCWSLDSNYRVENLGTGAITEYTEWRMCFDGSGQGRGTMRATNGTTCEGAVGARFDGEGRLIMQEGANLTCSDSTFIYRRDLSCALAGDGFATCTQSQSDVGRSVALRLRALGRE